MSTTPATPMAPTMPMTPTTPATPTRARKSPSPAMPSPNMPFPDTPSPNTPFPDMSFPDTMPAMPAAPAAPDDGTSGNVVVLTSATGGAGTSTFAAMLATALADRPGDETVPRVALVDADIGTASGGLDVLLGAERENGLRWHDVHAPLGTLDGAALWHDLPVWHDGVRLLAFGPWQSGEPPAWWDIHAAVTALAGWCAIVVVDAGRGALLREVPALAAAVQVPVVQLSVLGAARGRMQLEWLAAGIPDAVVHRAVLAEAEHDGKARHAGNAASGGGGRDGHDDRDGRAGRAGRDDRNGIGDRDGTARRMLIIGAEPFGSSRGRGALSPDALGDYLGHTVHGPLLADPQLALDMLEGRGLAGMSRRQRRVLDGIAGLVLDLCGIEGGRR
ncbi:hypothetical protein [Bifidobacterium choloepi]|uniref:P-loop NTPase n=1 Tax=Bifidobacterium choloepi TaxID=2614131 RepID=A0A6I5NM77_9BIFI|nr:hypothetical protein [Bifidobacterium choloepi]NEG69842.1 hypothetical protein [Bifidobacterium choloepi]